MLALLAAISLASWIYLVFAHHGYWRADQRLASGVSPLTSWPSVTAVVPARNEAATIEACIKALSRQRYDGDFHIVLVDDASTDGTGEIGRAAAPAEKLTVISAPPLATGWTGKLWALNSGISKIAADGQEPDFFWLTDADVVHPPETLMHLVEKAINHQRDLVSLMVRLHCRHVWERLLIPAFVYFFQMLYPFRAANDDGSRTAAAAGGCILIRRDALTSAGGLNAIRGEIIDDCALARAVKHAGSRIWIGLSDASASLREATSLGPLWAMVRRTAFTQLRHSTVLLAGTIAALAVILLAPACLLLTWPWHRDDATAALALAAMGLMSVSYAPTLREYGQGRWRTIFLPAAAALYTAMTLTSAVAHWRRRGAAWKGRTYD